MSRKQKGIVLSLSASLMFGLAPVLIKLTLDLVSPEMMNLLWSAFTSVFFVGIFIFFRRQNHFSAIAKNWKKLILYGLLSFVGMLFNAYGIAISGPISASFLLQFTAVFTIILGFVFLNERFTKQEGLGVLIAIVGVFVLSYAHFNAEILGSLLFLGASFLFSLGNLFAKIFVKNLRPVTLAGANSVFLFMYMLLYTVIVGRLETTIPSMVWVYTIIGSVLGGVVGFSLFFKALQVFEVSKTVTIRTIEPFLTAIFSFILLALSPSFNQLLGGILIVIGVITLSLTKQKRTAN